MSQQSLKTPLLISDLLLTLVLTASPFLNTYSKPVQNTALLYQIFRFITGFKTSSQWQLTISLTGMALMLLGWNESVAGCLVAGARLMALFGGGFGEGKFGRALRAGVANLVVLHLSGCLLMGLVKYSPQSNWHTSRPVDGPFDLYLNAFYFAACTLSTIGYGDFIATNPAQKIAVIGLSITGCALFAYNTGEIIGAWGDSSQVQTWEDQQSAQRALKTLMTNQRHKMRLQAIDSIPALSILSTPCKSALSKLLNYLPSTNTTIQQDSLLLLKELPRSLPKHVKPVSKGKAFLLLATDQLQLNDHKGSGYWCSREQVAKLLQQSGENVSGIQ